MRHSITERRLLMRNAAHLVRPLPFVMPTRRRLTRSRTAMAVALRLNDWIGHDRNRELPPHRQLPPGRLLSRAALDELLPGLDDPGITGGALWYDAQMRNTERLAFGYLRLAVEAGVRAANHVAAVSLLREGDRVTGVRVRDAIDDGEFDIRARLVLNTAGPWALELDPPIAAGLQLSKTMNLVVRPLVREHAIGVGEGGGRLLFLVPWRGLTMVGTVHLPYHGAADAFRLSTADVESFLSEVNRAYPAAALTPDDVRFVHRGLLPSTGTRDDGDAELLRHHRVVDHAARGGPAGLLSVVSVKWTTARAVAEQAVDAAVARLGKSAAPCRTAATRLPGADDREPQAIAREIGARTGLGEAAATHLAENHGAAWTDLVPFLEEAPGALSSATPVQRGEVLRGIREEMACTLPDLVLRRTELGSAGEPDEQALRECARIAAAELGWNERRTEAELDAVRERYRFVQ